MPPDRTYPYGASRSKLVRRLMHSLVGREEQLNVNPEIGGPVQYGVECLVALYVAMPCSIKPNLGRLLVDVRSPGTNKHLVRR